VRRWLALPYVVYLFRDRRRNHRWWQAPYVMLEDVVEVAAMLRGSVRYRTLVL
jgi:hypothetical protein